MLSGQRLWSCWSGPRDLLFAVGQEGAIFRRNSEGWHQDYLPESLRGADLYGVWGMLDGTAVAVGGGLTDPQENAVVAFFDGQSWERVFVPALETRTLRSVWASGPSDIWAVGDDGTIIHFDGDAWRPSTSGVSDRLFGIYGSGPGDIYAVGGSGRGVILRWNGSSWQEFDTGEALLRAVVTSPGGPLVVAGDSGYVARYGRVDGLPRPENITEAAPFPELRVNTLVGLGSAVMGAASTMQIDDETGDWLGSVVGYGRSFSGTIVESARPDAGVVEPPDAGPIDAELSDAGPTADAGF